MKVELFFSLVYESFKWHNKFSVSERVGGWVYLHRKRNQLPGRNSCATHRERNHKVLYGLPGRNFALKNNLLTISSTYTLWTRVNKFKHGGSTGKSTTQHEIKQNKHSKKNKNKQKKQCNG